MTEAEIKEKLINITSRLKFVGINASVEENGRRFPWKIVIRDLDHPYHEFWFYPHEDYYWIVEERSKTKALRGNLITVNGLTTVNSIGSIIIDFLITRFLREQPLIEITDLQKRADILKEKLFSGRDADNVYLPE